MEIFPTKVLKLIRFIFIYLYLYFLLTNYLSPQLEASYIHKKETPIVKYLKPIEITEKKSGLDLVDCIYVINLHDRPERWKRMVELFKKDSLNLNRVSAVEGWKFTEKQRQELHGPYGVNLKGGQIGCLLSHISVIKDAYDRGLNTIWVLEDDVEILQSVFQISKLLLDLTEIDSTWDVFYTDIDTKNAFGDYRPCNVCYFRPDQFHLECPAYNKRFEVGNGIMTTGLRFGTYSYIISRRGMKKMLNYFTHVYLLTPIDVDMHYVPNIHEYSSTHDIVSHSFQDNISDSSRH